MKRISILTMIILLGGLLMACNSNEMDYETMELGYQDYLNDTNPVVTFEIEGKGTMTLQLFPEVAPNSVNNMIKLIEDGYYDGLIFHRVIETFMIQGGWGEEELCPIAGEFNANGFTNELKHSRGVLSMARTMNPNSATSQFFIMHQNSPHLDGQYAGFGGLIDGFDILDEIATTATNASDRPLADIVIKQATVDTKGITYDAPVCYE